MKGTDSESEGEVTLRCGRVDFQAEYRPQEPAGAVVSFTFEDWYPSLGEAVTLTNGPSERRATVQSVRVSPHEQRVELALHFLNEAAER